MNYRWYFNIILLILTWGVFSSPYLLFGKVAFPSRNLVTFFTPWSQEYAMPVKNAAMPDVSTQIYPWKKLTIDTWKTGQVPLWNPYSFSGTVHAGNYQSAAFTPLNLLYFIFSFIDAWSISILLQPLIAGIGMLLFLKRNHLSSLGQLIGSVSFMFCGFITVWMAYGTLAMTIAITPFMFWALDGIVLMKKRINIIFLSVSLGLVFYSGHFQIALYSLIITSLYALFLLRVSKDLRMGFIAILAIVLGVCIASPQLLLTVDAYNNSARSMNMSKGEIIPWQYLPTIFAPDFYGNPVTRNDWYGHYAEWALYIGVVPLMTALYLVFLNKNSKQLFFLCSALLTLALAYQTPLVDLIYLFRIPVLSTSAASRVISLTSLSLSILSAFGFDRLMRDLTSKKRSVKIFVFVWMIMLGMFWLSLLFIKPFSTERMNVAIRNMILPSVYVGAFLFTILLHQFITSIRYKKFLEILIILLVAIDLLRFSGKWMPFEERKYVYPDSNVLIFLKNVTEKGDRVFGNIGGEASIMFGIPLIEGYDAMYQKKYAEFISSSENGKVAPTLRSVVLFPKNGKYNKKSLDFLGVKYLFLNKSDGRNSWVFPFWNLNSFTSVYSDDHFEVMRNDDAYPRAYFVGKYETIPERDLIEKIYTSENNLREIVYLTDSLPSSVIPGSSSAEIIKYSPNRVLITYSTDSPQILLLTDSYDNGWKAYIGNESVPIYRANYVFRAIYVPKGSGMITFEYKPISFDRGLIISFGALSLIFTIAFLKKGAST